MRQRLPKADDFRAFVTVELDREGRLLFEGKPVPPAVVAPRLAKEISVPARATDIFVLVHGWQHTEQTATAMAKRLFSAVWELRRQNKHRYPKLTPFHPLFISVQWPSRSNPFPWGYRRIRDRAHAMTTKGHAAHVIAALLGYLDASRKRPPAADVLKTRGGQFLHCVGHSFGCRMLGEAIMTAATPRRDPTLGWPWRSDHAFAVDSFLGLQMAAPPDIFRDRFRSLRDGRAPIAGPVVLTHSRRDRALSFWHRFPERSPGLGAAGAAGAHGIKLHSSDAGYEATDFARLTNVDASWLYRGCFASINGGHSDFWHPESIHLLLSLANFSR